LQALIGGGSSELVELEVETIHNDGQRATVRATGKVRTRVLDTQMVTLFDTKEKGNGKGQCMVESSYVSSSVILADQRGHLLGSRGALLRPAGFSVE